MSKGRREPWKQEGGITCDIDRLWVWSIVLALFDGNWCSRSKSSKAGDGDDGETHVGLWVKRW